MAEDPPVLSLKREKILFEGKTALFLIVAFLAGWHKIGSDTLSAPRQWNKMIHGQVRRTNHLSTIITATRGTFFAPPLGLS